MTNIPNNLKPTVSFTKDLTINSKHNWIKTILIPEKAEKCNFILNRKQLTATYQQPAHDQLGIPVTVEMKRRQ